ncbi:MAG: FG-GAP repeat domain-containing protein, partial [Blastococcus sp.]
ATGDWDTNGTTDFLVRRNDGALLLYSGNAQGGVSFVRTVAAAGWNPYTSILGVGDWDGDGLPDLLARKSDGTLWLYAGDGTGAFAGHRQVSAGWSSYRLAV